MQMDMTAGTVAIHDQIADDLRLKITTGALKPGDYLPSTRSLQDQWSVSDRTVRQALNVLLMEGRISVSRGAPARVRQPQERREISISLGAESAQAQKDLALRSVNERANTGAVELSLGVPIEETEFSAAYETVPADEQLAKEFSIEQNTPILRRTYRTVLRQTGKLALSSVSYIPVGLIESNPALLDESNEPWPGGHWHQLYTVGIEIDRLENSIIAVQPSTRQRQDWGMDMGVPLICLRSKSIDVAGRVVEVSASTYPADRTAISYTYQLQPWPDVTSEKSAKGS